MDREKLPREPNAKIRSCPRNALEKSNFPVMHNCGLAIAVANARDQVKEEAHWVTPNSGGDGALRDTVEYILRAQGKLKEITEKYIGERSRKTST